MKRLFSLLIISFVTLLIAACGGGGGSAGTPGGSASPTNFKVNAPSEATLALGSKVTYVISGGLAPYLVTNSAPTVVNAVVTAAGLEITPLSTGSAEVTVAPTGGGASFSMSVTISSSANPLQVQAPVTVTLQAGNSASYAILGGAPPYRAVSASPSVASVTVSGNSLQVSTSALGTATVEIYDSTSAAPIQRTFTVVSTTAFFTTAPASVAMGLGTSRNFTVNGGVAPYFVSSSNSAVADASVSSGTLSIIAGSSNGSANIVLRDSGGSTLTVAVSVGTNASFFSNAPAILTIQGGSSRDFTVGGGTAPYLAASGNSNVVVASVSGTTVTLSGQNKGTTLVSLADSAGAAISINVTVDQSGSFSVSGIELTSTLASIRSAGEEATISALVKGASNAGVPNADITFSSDSGILLAPSAQTDASGVATVKLAAGSNRANRDIVVSARVGSISQTLTVPVVGSIITISGSSALQIGGPASSYTARALDSAGNPIAGMTLVASSLTLNNGIAPVSAMTNSDGNAVFAYTPTNAGTDGRDTLRVRSSAGSTNTDGTFAISVSPVGFDFINPTFAAGTQFGVNQILNCVPAPIPPAVAVLPPLCRPEFRVRLLINNVPVVGRTVNFSSTRGVLSASSAVTDGVGEAAVSLTAASAGDALVTAQVQRQLVAPVDPGSGNILAEVSRSVSFTGVLPNNVRIQVNPTSIPPNAPGSQANKAEVSATVNDANANPVAGRQVIFNITADPSNGSLSAGLASTDNNGVARVQYIAGPNSSPTNGVTVTATVPPLNADIPVALVTNGVAPNSAPARLTVAGNALFITIGLSNTIENVPGDPSTYRKPFSVYVTDASGLAVPNQVVTLSVIPRQYYKGRLRFNGTVWTYETSPPALIASPTATCPSEDQFFADIRRNNGILDTGEDGPLNPNGNGDGRLTPGNVVIAAPATVTTDSAGLATFNLLYGEQYAMWVDVDVVATATVSGTESRSILTFGLTGLASDFNQETVAPAALVSPFGVASSCSNPN